MFHKMPVILIIIIAILVGLDPILPLEFKKILYGISLSIKSILVFFLPIIIFGLLFKAVFGMARHATRIIFLILVAVCCSNFFSTFLSQYVGMWVYQFDLSLVLPKSGNDLEPAFLWMIPNIIPNDKAMFAGIVLGILASFVKNKNFYKLVEILEKVISKILGSFTYLIPFFIIGFVLKLQFDGVIFTIIKDYTLIFAVIALAQFIYILGAYFILNTFNMRAFLKNIKNMLPAVVTGFSTMSSASAMPLTIIGVEKNAIHKDLVRSVVPVTVNIHLVGDCFAIPILAFAMLKNFGMPEPGILTYLMFTLYFVMAKFSVAAIPAGGILVMLPILETHLGFNGEMMSLITALYVLFDPVITSANVLGNGAFAKMIDKVVFRKSRDFLHGAKKGLE